MNGIEKITRRIDAETQADIDRILEAARAEAGKITADARKKADAEAALLKAKNEKTASEQEERLVRMAQMEARKVSLAAKQEMVEQAYRLALEKLCAMPEEQYVAVLADLLARASTTGREEVIFSASDRERVGEAAVAKANELLAKQRSAGALALSEEVRGIPGGFILKDNNVEANCAFDTLVRLQKTETAGVVAKKLFPEG